MSVHTVRKVPSAAEQTDGTPSLNAVVPLALARNSPPFGDPFAWYRCPRIGELPIGGVLRQTTTKSPAPSSATAGCVWSPDVYVLTWNSGPMGCAAAPAGTTRRRRP